MRKWELVWWLWVEIGNPEFDLINTFAVFPDHVDLPLLGEGGWVFAFDNLNLGLRTV